MNKHTFILCFLLLAALCQEEEADIQHPRAGGYTVIPLEQIKQLEDKDVSPSFKEL